MQLPLLRRVSRLAYAHKSTANRVKLWPLPVVTQPMLGDHRAMLLTLMAFAQQAVCVHLTVARVPMIRFACLCW